MHPGGHRRTARASGLLPHAAAVVFLALLVLPVLAAPATAGREETVRRDYRNSSNVVAGDFDSYQLDVGGRQDVSYHVRLTSGAETDIFLLTPTQLSQYKAVVNGTGGTFGYELRNERTREITRDMLAAGIYFLIVDNSAQPPGGANPSPEITYEVEIDYTDEPVFDFTLFLIAMIVIAGLAIAAGASHTRNAVRDAHRRRAEWERFRARAAEEKKWQAAARDRERAQGPASPTMVDEDGNQLVSDGTDESYGYAPVATVAARPPPRAAPAPRLTAAPGGPRTRYPEIPGKDRRAAYPGFLSRRAVSQIPQPAEGETEVACSICGSRFFAEELPRPFESQCPACGHWERVA